MHTERRNQSEPSTPAGQENRKTEFFKKLNANLENDDAKQQDQVSDEFRALILGH